MHALADTVQHVKEQRLQDRWIRPHRLEVEHLQPINGQGGDTLAYSPYLTLWASEFQRLRAQYQYLSAPGAHESQFFLQWTAIIGSHVHGFRDR